MRRENASLFIDEGIGVTENPKIVGILLLNNANKGLIISRQINYIFYSEKKHKRRFSF